MARDHRPLRVIAALVLAGGSTLLTASCAATAWRDLSEPVAVEDLTSLPAQVTPENARAVVRQCLQRHRGAASNVHHRYGYAFRDTGFVQLYTLNAIDRGRDRHARFTVEYASIQSVTSRIVTDTALLRRRVELTLRGRFRRWETVVTPYTPQPDLGAEPSSSEQNALVLMLDDADAAVKLEEALRLLAGK